MAVTKISAFSCLSRYFGQCTGGRKSSADIFICADISDFQLAIYTLSQIHDCSHHLLIYFDGGVQSTSEMHIFTCAQMCLSFSSKIIMCLMSVSDL